MPTHGALWIVRDGTVHWVMTCVVSEPGQWDADTLRADLPGSKPSRWARACRKIIRARWATYDWRGYLMPTEAGVQALTESNCPDLRAIRAAKAKTHRRRERIHRRDQRRGGRGQFASTGQA
jgi:hypothetical protein